MVVAVKDQVSADLAGEAVVLNLRSGIYYGLNAVGAQIWNLIQEPMAVSHIRDVLQGEYDVEPDRCERDLLALLQQLVNARLIEITDEIAA